MTSSLQPVQPSQAQQRPPRVMLLTSARSYRGQAFAQAAQRLGIEIIQVIDMPKELADYWDYSLGVAFDQPAEAVQTIVDFATHTPVDAILAIDDHGTILAAHASQQLGLPHNSLAAAEAARNKQRMRTLLAQADVASPRFQSFSTADAPAEMATQVAYPCVVKPVDLNGSRGVMRANDADELVAAVRRLRRLIDPDASGKQSYLVETYIPGVEVALEGLLDGETLHVLALFDKPDPLEGPFFEETIYVTPSRLPAAVQERIADCAAQAAAALGLRTGPVHAELRVNDQGPWIVEVAGRSIGGLCSKTLRFGVDSSLEELVLAQACGLPLASLQRERQAKGVMMIPIPQAGILRQVTGIEKAEAVPGIEEIQFTAKLNYPITPLPEGESYLGFIFAQGETPDFVETALRQAHRHLQIEIEPEIPLLAG